VAGPPAEVDEHLCPRCGAPHQPGQEYCLECGARLEPGPSPFAALATFWRDRFGWYPADWVWPVLLALLVAVIGGIVAVVLADSGRGGTNALIATQPGQPRAPVAPTPTATVALPTVPQGTPTTSGPPATPSKPPPAKSTPSTSGGLTTWPAGRSGWTVVLESIPTSAGRSVALARARAAIDAGLPQVGILNSGQFSSLHPGYYVVFSGLYASQGAANAAASTAGGKGFAAAYSRQISR
jgi:zinc-ribbon domain